MNYSIKLPPQKKILLWDDNLESFLNKYFNKNQYHVLYSRQLNYNLLIFIKSILKNNLKFSSYNYFMEYINAVNPKVLITLTDNNSIFYKLNKKGVVKFLIQNAWRTKISDIFKYSEQLKIEKKNNHVDYLFVFNNAIGKKYSVSSLKKSSS